MRRESPIKWTKEMTTKMKKSWISCWYFVFFFQAEDGIRDVAVTGVQTCALPISRNGAGGGVVAADGLCLWVARLGTSSRKRRRRRWRHVLGILPRAVGADERDEIGRASCRERVGSAVVRGALEKKRQTSTSSGSD